MSRASSRSVALARQQAAAAGRSVEVLDDQAGLRNDEVAVDQDREPGEGPQAAQRRAILGLIGLSIFVSNGRFSS